MKHTTKSPEETHDLAFRFASQLNEGNVLLLTGELGAGKTCFIQGLAAGLDVPEGTYVRSPSFTLINEYRGGRLDLYHIDFYRLDEGADLEALGLDEYFYSNGITAVEWADKFPDSLPSDGLAINFRIIDENTRTIEIQNPKSKIQSKSQ